MEKIFENNNITFMTEKIARSFLPKRTDKSHKGDYGKLLIVAGCRDYIGAANITTSAALRTGVGLTTLASVSEVIESVSKNCIEATFLSLDKDEDGLIYKKSTAEIIEKAKDYNALLLGCGLGQNENTMFLVEKLIKNIKIPIIIDADGINQLSKNIDILKDKKADIILTPHPLELARLVSLDKTTVMDDRLNIAHNFAKKYNVSVLSKSVESFCVGYDSDTVYYSHTGNSALSKGGSGDLLAGMTASFIAQGVEINKSGILAQFILGYSADILAETMSKRSILARDILNVLPFALKKLEDQ